MASTIPLQNTVNWAQTFVCNMPLAGQGGVANEPALTIANSVLGFLLGPPFAWRWNRNRTSILTTQTAGVYNQTYQVSLPDFGWVEKATLTDGTTAWPLEVSNILDDSTDIGRPDHIAAEWDDDAGNITFKLYPVPDKAYTVKVIYQKKPVLLTDLTKTWAPIPDEDQYIYNSGFLASAFENVDDARFALEYQKFIRSVIAKVEGLNDAQKQVFLEEKLVGLRQQQNYMMGAQQGRASRGMQ